MNETLINSSTSANKRAGNASISNLFSGLDHFYFSSMENLPEVGKKSGFVVDFYFSVFWADGSCHCSCARSLAFVRRHASPNVEKPMTHDVASVLPLVLFVLAPAIMTTWAGWRILVRAGYKGVWSLTLLVPLLNIVLIYVFAFSRWPIEESGNVADVFR